MASNKILDTFCNKNVVLNESNKKYLIESKMKYPYLSESILLENKLLIEDMKTLEVTNRHIMDAFHVDLVEARNLNEAFKAFAIATYYARTESDVEVFNEKLDRAYKDILLIEEVSPELKAKIEKIKKIKALMAKRKADPKATSAPIAPNTPDPAKAAVPPTVAAAIVPVAGVEPKAAEKEKKGFLAKIKDFLAKAWEIIVAVSKEKAFYKALAMGALMVTLGLIAGALGGWFAIGFAAMKGIMALFSIYKGVKGLIKSGDFAQGKKGIEGVKEWIKSVKTDPKKAAQVLISLAKIAMGIWGAVSAIGKIMNTLAAMDAAKLAAEHASNATPTGHGATAHGGGHHGSGFQDNVEGAREKLAQVAGGKASISGPHVAGEGGYNDQRYLVATSPDGHKSVLFLDPETGAATGGVITDTDPDHAQTVLRLAQQGSDTVSHMKDAMSGK